jgi:hypothetical protein
VSKSDFSKISIPAVPSAIAVADAALRDATAARHAAQERHERAMIAYKAQQPGIPPSVTAAEVDRLGAEIQTRIDAEAAARVACRDARAAHQRKVEAALTEPLSRFETELVAAFDNLDQMLAAGARIATEARKAKVELPSRVPGRCTRMRGHPIAQAQRILTGARIGNA